MHYHRYLLDVEVVFKLFDNNQGGMGTKPGRVDSGPSDGAGSSGQRHLLCAGDLTLQLLGPWKVQGRHWGKEGVALGGREVR